MPRLIVAPNFKNLPPIFSATLPTDFNIGFTRLKALTIALPAIFACPPILGKLLPIKLGLLFNWLFIWDKRLPLLEASISGAFILGDFNLGRMPAKYLNFEILKVSTTFLSLTSPLTSKLASLLVSTLDNCSKDLQTLFIDLLPSTKFSNLVLKALKLLKLFLFRVLVNLLSKASNFSTLFMLPT